MVFCNIGTIKIAPNGSIVTILILIDGFLQCEKYIIQNCYDHCHNPYFNRWFSAIKACVKPLLNSLEVTILILIDGFLQSN